MKFADGDRPKKQAKIEDAIADLDGKNNSIKEEMKKHPRSINKYGANMAEIAGQDKILKDAQQKNEAVETAQKLDKIDVPFGEIFKVLEISNMASREKFMVINKDKKEKIIERIKFEIAVDKEINAKEPTNVASVVAGALFMMTVGVCAGAAMVASGRSQMDGWMD